MEKYDDIPLDTMSRTKRNQNVYNMTDLGELSRIKTNTNVSVISDAPKEIDLEKIKNFVYSMDNEEEEKRRKLLLDIPEEEPIKEEKPKEEKDYDINSVLERAKDKRNPDYEEDRHRKINNTQIDILKNIKIKEEKIEEEKDPDVTEPIDELNTEEKTIVDLIQDIQTHGKKKDLFEDLMGENDDTIVAPIEEEASKNESLKEDLLNMTHELERVKIPENEYTHEINLEKELLKETINKELEKNFDDKKNTDEENDDESPKVKDVDKSFYSNSLTFNKSDFDGFEDLENGVKKSSILTKIAIFFIVLLLLGTIFLILNFVFDWNLL